jgi:hypothetical protein
MSEPEAPAARQYSASGRRVEVCATAETHHYIQRIYGPALNGLKPVCDSFQLLQDPEGWRLLEGDRELACRPRRWEAVEDLEATICVRVLEARSDLVTIHGATLIAPAGTLFITGPSEAGKTTLSLALTGCGWRLPSDDLAFVHADTNELEPMIRCFHIDPGCRELLTSAGMTAAANADGILTPRDLGYTGGRVAAPRWFISLLPGEGRQPSLRETTQAAALGIMSQEGGRGNAAWPEALATLANLIGSARCYKMTRGELPRMVSEIRQLVT